jgi:shikimate dehydrogenase
MTNFGLIGKTLRHSFSKSYFENKFRTSGIRDHLYNNIEIADITDFKKVISGIPGLRGLNVTLPYKESVIGYLDGLSGEAKEIGAVNCISIKDGRLTGHNTDAYGFSQSIKPFLDVNHQRALILGTGGSAKAVAFALKKTGVEVFFVTSSPVKKTPSTFFYNEINNNVMDAFGLIVNTTPLGMFPDIKRFPVLPYHLFTPLHLAYDLIYNPDETLFLKQARKQGATVVNGLSMLQLQAEKSWEIWSQS